MTLKGPYYLTEQGYKNLIILQTQYNKVVEQNRQLQQERMRLISNNNFISSELNQIKLLLEGKNTECTVFKERCEKYLKALDDIEKIVRTITETNRIYPLHNLDKVLDIINYVKGGENE